MPIYDGVIDVCIHVGFTVLSYFLKLFWLHRHLGVDVAIVDTCGRPLFIFFFLFFFTKKTRANSSKVPPPITVMRTLGRSIDLGLSDTWKSSFSCLPLTGMQLQMLTQKL